MAQALPFIAAGAQIIGALGTVSSLFGGGGGGDSPSAPAIPAAPEKPDQAKIAQDADLKTRQRLAANKGREGTFLTSPLGIEDAGTTVSPTLLGA